MISPLWVPTSSSASASALPAPGALPPEMVIVGLRKGLRIIEVPVNYRGRVGESKITGTLRGTLRTGFRMIGLILRFRLS